MSMITKPCTKIMTKLIWLPVPQLLRFSLDVLKTHNDIRALHGVEPMKMSETVNNQWFLLLLVLWWKQFLSWAKKLKSWRRRWWKITKSLRLSELCKEWTFWGHGHPMIRQWWVEEATGEKYKPTNLVSCLALLDKMWTRLQHKTYNDHILQLSGAEVVDLWYVEADHHDYLSETLSAKTGEVKKKWNGIIFTKNLLRQLHPTDLACK